MKVDILLTSNNNLLNKDDFNLISGKIAGVCYMKDNFASLLNEPVEKSLRRAENTKINGHHSVFEHEYISLYLEDVPKLFAMLLNNEKVFVTSEKSARYTNMESSGITKELYDKWYGVFVDKITKRYGDIEYCTKNRIDKLAKENARYFLSVYTPTSLVYTTSYRQLNYIYIWLKNLKDTENKYLKPLLPVAEEFCYYLEKNNLIDNFEDNKDRTFSLFTNKGCTEYFGDVYITSYEGSFASFAQAQRHRTLSYQMQTLCKEKFFVPKLIIKDDELKNMWLDDMQMVKDLHPQAELVNIIEKGTPENFILKTKERLCTSAQQEVMEQTKNTLVKYIKNTKDEELKKELESYNKGARCTAGYKCTMPCHFKEGINLEREI